MITIVNDKCDFCGTCVAVCPVDAIELAEARIEIIHPRCTDCKLCVWVCPVETLEHVDQEAACEPSMTASL